MKPDWYKLSYVAHQLQEATSVQDATDIWCRYPDIVNGADLVFAAPDSTDFILPSSRWDIKSHTDSYPRCLYYTDNLYFLNNEIVINTYLQKDTEIKCDLTIMLDSNVAGEIKHFIIGKRPLRSNVKAVLDFLIREEINFTNHHYIFENARRYFNKPCHAKYVYETFYYIQYFDYLDKSLYLTDGTRKAIIDEQQLLAEAGKLINETYGSLDYRPFLRDFLNFHYLTYLAILKIVEIEFGYPQKRFETKLKMLLDFMHSKLHRILQRELILAVAYFKDRNSVGFMHKINVGCETPLERISNIAWDIMLFRAMEKFATVTTMNGKLIPYFISFDVASLALFDKYRIKALISCGEEGEFHSVLHDRIEDLLFESIEDESKKRDLQRYFMSDFREFRLQELTRGNSPSRKYVRQLEKRVCVECLKTSY